MDENGGFMGFDGIYMDLPSGYVKIAMENGHRNTWFTNENGDFP